MLISLQWINSMLSGPDLDPGSANATLTSLGLEVDGVEATGQGLERIVVGEVRGKGPHPHADRLTVVQLFHGGDTVNVVCGASNLPEVGGKVAFAPVGACLPPGRENRPMEIRPVEIRPIEIRGVASHGMICSEAELEIGPDASGILVLSSDWIAGHRLVDRIPGLVDQIFELGLTPNRPDALGHVGVARDLAARLQRTVEPPSHGTLPPLPVQDDLVTLESPDRCGRYHGISLTGATVQASPLWMRVRLHRLGLRPINNLVDITNFVLMEWGQPLHAFDRARLEEQRVVIRMATAGERMTTLDEQERELAADDLVIADARVPQALAGVMGGVASAVSGATTELLLEAAWFLPAGVRRTARRTGLRTDSSHRFERGVDHGPGLEAAAARALSLVVELSGATPTARRSVEGELPVAPTIRFRPARSDRVLGMSIAPDEAAGILTRLEITVDRKTDPKAWRCVPPRHRPDLQREEDLIEEVMRMHGLDDLPVVPTLPSEPPRPTPTRGPSVLIPRITDALRETGLNEGISWVFQDPDRLGGLGLDVNVEEFVGLQNPMRAQSRILRPHMLPGLLDAVALNVARHAGSVRMFEVGRIYRWDEARPLAPDAGPTAAVDRQLPAEPARAAFVLSQGRSDETLTGRDAVGVALDTLSAVGLPARTVPVPAGSPAEYLHPGVRAQLELLDGTRVGMVGEVHPKVLRSWDMPEGVRVHYGELHLDVMPDLPTARYREIPRFPSVRRDLSLEGPIRLPASEVVDSLQKEAARATSDGPDPVRLEVKGRGEGVVEVLEDYRGLGIPEGARALLLRLHYRAQGRSVTDTEVDRLHEEIVTRVIARLSSAAWGEVRRR